MMAPSRSTGGFVRTACMLISLIIAGWAGTTFYLHTKAYQRWLDENADELGRHQRIVSRYERRQISGVYLKLSPKVHQKDLLASELSAPILNKLQAERELLLQAKKRAILHLKITLGVIIVLMLIARAMPPPL